MKVKRMWRSAVAALLTLCMVVGMVPAALAAEENPRKERIALAVEKLVQLVAEKYGDEYDAAYAEALEAGYMELAKTTIAAALETLHAVDLSQLDPADKAEAEALILEVEEALDAAAVLVEAADTLDQATAEALTDALLEASEGLAALRRLLEITDPETYEAIIVAIDDLEQAVKALEAVPLILLKGGIGAIPELQLALDNVAQAMGALVGIISEDAALGWAKAVAFLKDVLNRMHEDAVSATYSVDEKSSYLALGDATAAGKSYVDQVAAAIDEATEGTYTYVNLSQDEMMIQDAYAAVEDYADQLAKADLVTLGFGSNGFTNFAVSQMMAVVNDEFVELDWLTYVGEEGLAYVEQIKADLYAELIASGVSGEYMGVDITDLLMVAVESYAYSYVVFLRCMPDLVEAIQEANEYTQVVIVGMYNPLKNITLKMDKDALPLGEYVQYLVNAVNLTELSYAMGHRNVIFVDAPDVEVKNKKTEMTMLQFMSEFLFYRGANLNPTDAGHSYIAGQIMDALTVRNTWVKWISASASLEGNIGMNFYVKLAEELVEDASTYVRFTFADQVLDVPMEDALKFVINGQTQYRFTCPINAKNMSDEIKAQVMNADGPVEKSKSLAAVTYCDYMIRYGGNAELASLMKAMLNYGAAAQILFNYNTDNLANAGLAENDKVLADVDASAYAAKVSGSEEGLALQSASLLLETETSIRIYFKLTGSKTIDQYTFLVDGEEVTPVHSGSQYYVEIADIAAQDLDAMHTVTVGGITVQYSGLSYVNMVMNNQNIAGEALANAARALFVYNKLAESYFN